MARVVSRALVGAFLGGVVAGGCGSSATAQGSVSLTWSIFDARTGLPAACSAVGAAAVALQATPQAAGGASLTLTLPCARGSGAGELAAGAYRIVPQLVTADGEVLATAPEQSATLAVGSPMSLAPAVFAARTSATTRSGFLMSSLSIGPAGVANCQGGAGMTGVALVLAHGDGGCAPVQMVRSRGGLLVGTYDANSCASPSVTSCIEADETITVGDLEPGPYILRVRGKKGALECWTADEPITLVPGAPLIRALTLARSSAPGC